MGNGDVSEMVEARGWLTDCGVAADGLSDRDTRRIVDSRYSGGWAGFRADQNPPKGNAERGRP